MAVRAPVPLSVLLVGDAGQPIESAIQGATESQTDAPVRSVSDTRTGIDALEGEVVDCVVVTVADPAASVAAIRDAGHDTPIVAMTDEADAADALAAGATEHVLREVATERPALLTRRVRDAAQTDPDVALPRSPAWYEALLERSVDALTVLQADGTIAYQNPSVERLLGYEPAELLGTDSLSYIHPEDRQRVEDAFAGLYEAGSGATADLQFRFQAADGSWEHLESVATARPERGIEGYVVNSSVITERTDREREVERYETLLSAIPDTIAIVDLAGYHVDVYGLEGWSGYDREDLVGEHVSKTMPEPDRERARAVVSDLVTDDDREKATFETRVETADGELVPFENHVTTLPPDEDGTVPGTMHVLRDVSDRKERERDLQKAETVFQNVPDGVFLVDVTDGGRFEYERVNPAFESVTGLDATAVRGRTPAEFIPHEGVAAEVESYFSEVVETGSPIHDEHHLDVPELPAYLEFWVAPIFADGDVDGLVGILRDVTERKEREADLELKTRAMDEAPIGISISEVSGDETRLRHVNEGYETLTGYDAAELVGSAEWWTDLFGEETDEESVEKLAAALDTGRSVSTELQLYRKDGTPRWFQISLSPLESEDGELTHLVTFQQDITDRKEYETEIERRFDEFADVFADDLGAPIEQARNAVEAARQNGDEEALAEAETWLARTDDLLEDLATVHSHSVPSRDHSESALRGSPEDA